LYSFLNTEDRGFIFHRSHMLFLVSYQLTQTTMRHYSSKENRFAPARRGNNPKKAKKYYKVVSRYISNNCYVAGSFSYIHAPGTIRG
ncbi:MAG: hypothetical protein WCS37_22160, partial [Chloroflexota bacterium]